jgi:hypothetical protein
MLHLDVSLLKKTVLPVDMSVLQQPVLPLDVCGNLRCFLFWMYLGVWSKTAYTAPGRVCSTAVCFVSERTYASVHQQPVLHHEVPVLQQPLLHL